MRRAFLALVLAVAFIVPAGVAALDPSPPGSPQANALANPDKSYMGPDECVQFTPNSARAWWTAWFAQPYDMLALKPCELPGSLVLTADQYDAAVAINENLARVARAAPPAPLMTTVVAPAGPTAAQLAAIWERAVAVGKHPTAGQVLATWYRHH